VLRYFKKQLGMLVLSIRYLEHKHDINKESNALIKINFLLDQENEPTTIKFDCHVVIHKIFISNNFANVEF
jgi:hypothetical protein